MPRLQELVEDGRKVLVFSQFTTLLGLLRARLDEAGLTYEYLDGKTRDREARVRRFQDDGCPLFLVSLKAGGLGLNLTAAEYVWSCCCRDSSRFHPGSVFPFLRHAPSENGPLALTTTG